MPHHDHHEHGHHHEHEDRLTAADRREILSLLRDGCLIVRDVFKPHHEHHHAHRPSVVQVTVTLGQHRPKQGTHAMTTTNVNIPSPPPLFDSTQEFDVSLTFTAPDPNNPGNAIVLPQQSAIDWESTDPSVADVIPSSTDPAKATVSGISSAGGTASINFGVDLLVDGKTYRATGSFPVTVAATSTGTETVNVGVSFSEARPKTGT